MTKKIESKNTKEQSIEVNSFDEAEKIVYEQIRTGKNTREISQMTFIINDITKRYNPHQIRQIKDKHIQKSNNNNLDPEKALCFKLFKNGFSPSDVVIKTKLAPQFVQKAYQEFLEFEDKEVFSKKEIQDLYDFVKMKMGWGKSLKDIKFIFKILFHHHDDYMKLFFDCVGCGEPMDIDDKMLAYARNYLAKNWRHKECWENG